MGEHHDLYVQRDFLLLGNLFGIFWNMEQAALKKTKVKLDLLTHINILLIEEKSNRWGICHAIYQYKNFLKCYNNDSDIWYSTVTKISNL